MGRRAPNRLPRLQSPRSGGAKRIPLRRAKSQPAAPLPERSPLVWPQTQAAVWKSLQRRGGRERPLPRGTSQRLQRGARGMQRRHGTGTKPRSSGARFLTTGKLLGEGRLGCLGVPQGALAEFSLQRPGYFGTLERAKFQMYHTERSCFRRQGWPVTHQAMSFLTKQRQPRPGTPPGVRCSFLRAEGSFHRKGAVDPCHLDTSARSDY